MRNRRKVAKTGAVPAPVLAKPAAPPFELPDYIANAPLMQRKRISRLQLSKYQESMLLLFSPELIPKTLEALLQKVSREGDMPAITKVLEMYGFVQKGSGGVNVTTNIMNATVAGGGGYSRDRIIRELAAKQHQRLVDVTPE